MALTNSSYAKTMLILGVDYSLSEGYSKTFIMYDLLPSRHESST